MKIAILFALTLTALEAQSIEVRSFSQIAPLDGNWKFSPSDDPRFAAPDFDDSAWRTVRVPGEALPQPIGVSWIRFQVQLPDTGEPLTLLLPPLISSNELFVNSRLVRRFGDGGYRIDAAENFAVLSGARNLTVAIRLRRITISLSLLLAARSAWIGTSQAIAAKQRQVALEVRWRSVVHLTMMSATAMAGLFFVVLPLWRRDSWDYFWCGVWLINVPGFTIEAAYLPMSEVGGDFYWTRAEADGGLLVVVGDVSGKGLKAAMLVSVTIGMLRRESSTSPGAILAALNDGLAGHMGSGFVTCVCARFDSDGKVTTASAGHPSPYADGQELALTAGLPLGIAAGVTYDESTTTGHHFIFVSDGVVEAENAQRELFGFDRTREVSGQSATEIAEAAKAWGQNDDITVVTVRRLA